MTQRRDDEARALDAEAQLALALESGEMGTWHVDLETRHVKLSPQAAAIFGVSEDPDAETISSALHPDDRCTAIERWEQAAARGDRYSDEFRIVRPDGEVRWLSSRGSTKILEGIMPYFSGVIGDVTERNRLEMTAQAQRHTLETIFRESPAAMALWRGPEHIFELVNPQYQAIFGERPLVGKRMADAAPELAAQGFVELLDRVFATGESYVGHEVLAQIATASGELEDHYYDFTYVRVLDVDGNPYGVYDHALDVTDRVRVRRAMEQERDLRERMVAAISHDLRTPLATAKLGAQLLVHRAHDPDQLAVAAKRIVDNMDRADRMIRDLLDVSRVRGGEEIPLDVEACDVGKVAQSVVEDLSVMHGKRFVLQLDPGLEGYWDCHALRRIIENLASNAVKYGALGKSVTIRIANVDAGIHLSVHNEGKPIAPVELPSLFDLFKRSRSARAQVGWGVGLSLVHALAHAHGGTVTVESSEATGTTFTVRLPRDARRP